MHECIQHPLGDIGREVGIHGYTARCEGPHDSTRDERASACGVDVADGFVVALDIGASSAPGRSVALTGGFGAPFFISADAG
jgi:deoxyxylulose-5-phosphate synthase